MDTGHAGLGTDQTQDTLTPELGGQNQTRRTKPLWATIDYLKNATKPEGHRRCQLTVVDATPTQ